MSGETDLRQKDAFKLRRLQEVTQITALYTHLGQAERPAKKKYRFETFSYGPKSCPLYRAGATRKVPGRAGMSWEEED